MMKKIAPFALLILGFLLMSGSFIYYAGNAIPYPDATSELLAYQTAQANKWALLFALGLVVTATGAAWLWRRRRAKKRAQN
jgi:LPXTG-motif cell wall-anchored protein